jgi:Uma2 family endonuclease
MATLPKTFDETERLWTVQEYLRSSWHPDREFVDGRIEERNLGEIEHSILQRFFTVLFYMHRADWRVEVFPELRAQTQARRFRVPDVLVMRTGDKIIRYVTQAPLIAIEILSPEDRLSDLQTKAAEYRGFGVENIWVIDPEKRIAYSYDGSALIDVKTGEFTVPGTPIRVALSEMFAELDRA